MLYIVETAKDFETVRTFNQQNLPASITYNC